MILFSPQGAYLLLVAQGTALIGERRGGGGTYLLLVAQRRAVYNNA